MHEMRSITDDFEAIILTGHGDEERAIQAMRDGAINFLKKPLDLDQLIVAVEKAIEKINSDRSLKYRIRELELAKEIIAKITAEKEIVIDVRDRSLKPARKFAQELLDALPMGVLVLDNDMNIRLINRYLATVVGDRQEKIDEEFVQRLRKIGIQELSYDSLVSAVNKLFESPTGTLETISTGKYAYFTLTALTILHSKKQENVVMITI